MPLVPRRNSNRDLQMSHKWSSTSEEETPTTKWFLSPLNGNSFSNPTKTSTASMPKRSRRPIILSLKQTNLTKRPLVHRAPEHILPQLSITMSSVISPLKETPRPSAAIRPCLSVPQTPRSTLSFPQSSLKKILKKSTSQSKDLITVANITSQNSHLTSMSSG